MRKKLGDLVSIALERVHKGDKGFEFENFAQNLSRCERGKDFFATSPFKDGGIDGFITKIDEDTVVTKKGKPGIIFQYGTTESYANKIRATFNDLLSKGIDVRKITYYSPRSISQIVKQTNILEDELDIAIQIIDQAQLCSMAANNECQHIFQEFVTTILGVLESNDDKKIILDYPALYLSALYRYDDKTEQNKTITNVADNLIIWALRDTSPEDNIFMQEEKIYQSIEKEFPTAKTSIKSMFNDRLKFLNKQRTKYSRQAIQKHKQGYCLPIETREEFKRKKDESSDVLLLAKTSLIERITENFLDEKKLEIVELILHTLKHVFTKQGMKLTTKINSKDEDSYDDINLRDAIICADQDLKDYTFREKDYTCVSSILRKVFVKPSKSEQEYLIRASHLYIMHYVMHNNMDIISYFQEKTKRLNLIVHSDIIILALSEQYLPKEGQHYRNMLMYLIDSGADLILTEEALTEIYMNIRIASYEYKNHIQSFENHFTLDSIKYLPVMMTRAYLYSKNDKLVSSWEEYVNNFCTLSNLHNNKGKTAAKEELKIYLTDMFKVNILRTNALEKDINIKLAEELTSILRPYKKKLEMAKHVANVNIYVSTIRNNNKEISDNPFGYKTYWLTREKTAYNIAEKFFNKNDLGTHLIMRPEFIMQQIMFTPDSESIAKSYTATFPTALGMQMSQHLNTNTFHGLMKKLDKVSKIEPSRAKALLNGVIKIAAETTPLVHDMSFYEQEAYSNNLDKTPRVFNETLQDNLNYILEEAEKRLIEQGAV